MATMYTHSSCRILLSSRSALLVIAVLFLWLHESNAELRTTASGRVVDDDEVAIEVGDGEHMPVVRDEETIGLGVGLSEGYLNGENIYIGWFKVRKSQTSDVGDTIPLSPCEETTTEAAKYKLKPNVLYTIEPNEDPLYANFDASIADIEEDELPLRLIDAPDVSKQNGTFLNVWIDDRSYWFVEIKRAHGQPDDGTLYDILSDHFDDPFVKRTISYLETRAVDFNLIITDVSEGISGELKDAELIEFNADSQKIQVIETIRTG